MTEGTPVSPQPELPAMPPPPDSSSTPPNDPALAIHNRVVALTQTGDKGANWFYWVAGLSLVNSALQLGGGGIYFVVGLGTTLLADSIAVQLARENPDVVIAAKALTIGFDLFVALLVCGFGWLSRKRYLPVFAIGMALYLLDGLLFVIIQDWMSVAFHAFALYSMIGGFMAYRQLNIVQRQFA